MNEIINSKRRRRKRKGRNTKNNKIILALVCVRTDTRNEDEEKNWNLY